MPDRIILYTAKICPYAQRAEIALHEANAQFVRQEIDLQNKPEWYAPLVNPASKVPALVYGGPATAHPSSPSPSSTKLAESLVLVEFVADLYPSSRLLPPDPVLRARARLFIDGVSTKLVPAWQGFLRRNGPVEDLYKAVEHLQALLPSDTGEGEGEGASRFAVGEYSIADVAITPFLARMKVALTNELGAYPVGEGARVWEALSSGRGQFARFGRYVGDVFGRESHKATFDEAYVTKKYKTRFADLRSQL